MENYQITRDQIRKLTDPQVKEWFPEAFENELEVGKWYRGENGTLFFLEKINTMLEGHGFTPSMIYYEDFREYTHTKCVEATEEEVFEALKNEAIKRGFVGNKIQLIAGKIGKISPDKLSFFDCYSDENGLFMRSNTGDYYTVFLKGKWATVIETITKEEAEKLLNKKIID